MVNGGADYAFSQGRVRLCREAGFSHGLGESGEEQGLTPWVVEGLEVWVVSNADLFEEEGPALEASSPVFLCLVHRAIQTGKISSREESHNTILDGR